MRMMDLATERAIDRLTGVSGWTSDRTRDCSNEKIKEDGISDGFNDGNEEDGVCDRASEGGGDGEEQRIERQNEQPTLNG